MTLTLRTEVLDLPFRDPFRIARTEDSEAAHTVLTELDVDGATGLGECFPVAYYGETLETIAAVLPRLLGALEGLGALPTDREAALAWLERSTVLMTDVIGDHGGAKAGLDIALHDLVARRMGHPAVAAPGHLGPRCRRPTSRWASTTPAEVAARAQRAAQLPGAQDQGRRPGGPRDAGGRARGVRRPLRVDANTGWQPEQAAALIPELVRLGVELIEQPFPAHQLPQLRWLQERSPLPIVADESGRLDRRTSRGWWASWRASNVKIDEVRRRRPGPAHDAAGAGAGLQGLPGLHGGDERRHRGRGDGRLTADWIDLDGNLLLARDPFGGLELGADCRWQLRRSPAWGSPQSA